MAVRKLREGRRAVGTMLRMVGNPAVALVAANAGLDFIMLDLEHGPFSLETLENVFKVGRGVGLGCFVRVPELSKAYVSRCLDLGATGVMVPMLESVEQARRLVHWAKFAPLGSRGFGGVGAHSGYQSIPAESTVHFMAEANEQIITIAQIETAQAIREIDSIAAVEGLDALLIGPNDLAISMGCPGELMGEQLDQAISKVADAAKTHNKIFGMHAPDPLTERWLARGLRLVMSSLDAQVLLSGFRAIAQRYSS